MEKSRQFKDAVGAYAVQCDKCFKWRVIPTKEEYEDIRESFAENPFRCEKRPNVSCDDPGDIEYDTSRLWVIDKPNIPKSPPNTERHLVMRRDFSKMDANYTMPNGKKVRSVNEVEKFLEAYPEYKGELPLSSFVFTVPKILEDMVPRSSEGKASANSNKKMKTPKVKDELED